jgi:hypothetical protein
MTYLHFDPDTFRESQDDRSPAHVEYLGLQVLGAGPSAVKAVDPMRESELTFEAIDLVRKMFRTASMLTVIGAVAAWRDRADDPTVEYSLFARLESLTVRGVGYPEHLKRVIHGCLDPFDTDCRDLLGFTASEALILTNAITDLISDRLAPVWKETSASRSQLLRDLKRERRRPGKGGGVPDWLTALPPNQAKMQVGRLATTVLFADSRSLAVITGDDLAGYCSLDPAVCQAFLEAFACPPERFDPKHHALPGGAHPLTEQPILRVPEGFVLPVPSAMIDAIRPRMEDLLHLEQKVWDRYVRARGVFLEREATSLVHQAIPGSRSWQGIGWRSATDSSDLDGLVAADDLAVRLQCKAGRLSASARRGGPLGMRQDIGDLIEDAARQHRALATALGSDGAKGIGLSDEQAAALDAPFQVEVVVCLDDVTVWATEAHKLRALGALPLDRHVPWVLSLTDLMVVVDLLQGGQFVHYALRRQRLERQGRIEAHDELDWVGHYLSEGLYFDDYLEIEGRPDVVRLLSYTEPIDAWYFTREGVRTVKAPKPSQPIPPKLALLIRRLEGERPRHWIPAVVALLEGDQATRDVLDDAISHIRERLPQQGWSNASLSFNGRFGLTLFFDRRTPWPLIRDRLMKYCRTKAEAQKQPNWIGVGEGVSGPLFVIVISRDPDISLAEVFLDPTGSATILVGHSSIDDAELPIG